MIMTTDDYNKILNYLYEYLCGILRVYEDLLPVLKGELDAIQREDISSLDENLKVQQALLYQTRNFDREIAGYTSKLNIQADNLSSLILQIPGDRQPRFHTFLNRFTAVFQEVAFYKDQCRTVLQTRLHNIDKALAAHTGRQESRIYGRDASKIRTALPKSFETTI